MYQLLGVFKPSPLILEEPLMRKVNFTISFTRLPDLVDGVTGLIAVMMLDVLVINQASRIPTLVSAAYHAAKAANIGNMYLLERCYGLTATASIIYCLLFLFLPAKVPIRITFIAGTIAVLICEMVAIWQFAYLNWLGNILGDLSPSSLFYVIWGVIASVLTLFYSIRMLIRFFSRHTSTTSAS